MKRWSQVASYNKSFDAKLFDYESCMCGEPYSLRFTRIFSENQVYQYLESLAMQNNNLVILENHKAILRRDHLLLIDQVKILSGGESGNEPLHAEYVGEGLLTAAVMGEVNSCPPHTSILAVIRELSKNNSSVFVIIMNYASYRLNFGIAIQNALLEGIKVAAVVVEDDCSGVITDKTVGRRTLAGVVFMHKVVGAMAEDKKNLYEIECISKSISKNSIGSINIHMYKDEALFGVGLKGELGQLKVSYKTKDESDYVALNNMEIVEKALSFIVSPVSYFSLPLKKNDPVAILVNNFKDLSHLDLSLFVSRIVYQIHKIPLNIVSLNFGNYLSSNSVLGFSITLFKVDNPRVLKWLFDANNIFTVKKIPENLTSLYIDEENVLSKIIEPHKSEIGPIFSKNDVASVKRMLNTVITELHKNKDIINSLDFDEDCGTAMSKFAHAVSNKLENSEINISSPRALMLSLSDIAASSMGGLSSGIYSVLFCSAAHAFANYSSTEPLTYKMWAEAACSANKSLYNYLRVEQGYRTIVDALEPFAETLCRNPVDVKSAIEAAEIGVSNTIYMVPKTHKTVGGAEVMSPDAGAYAFTLIMKSVYFAFFSDV